VASSEPSSDLLTLLRSFNPDFLFDLPEHDEVRTIVLNWLKVCPATQSANIISICLQESQPLPEDLIQLWEDYQFMAYCEQIWIDAQFEDRQFEVTSSDRDHSYQILSQASPSLIRILQAIRFIPWDGLIPSGYLFKIHFRLDFSWNELRTVISSLRSLIHDEGEELMRKLLIVSLDPTLFPVHFDLIMHDLACGSLRVIQRILRGELIKNMM
jgi:hypothetical protein